VALVAPASAQDAAAEIREIISGQIEAFKADDFETAFSFASPGIKRMFGSSDRFGQMVRSGYPMVWRPARVRFTALTVRDGRQVQSVLVTDQAGALHVLDYEMVPAGDGWQINGVWLREADAAGA
jgi:hypothetical protein